MYCVVVVSSGRPSDPLSVRLFRCAFLCLYVCFCVCFSVEATTRPDPNFTSILGVLTCVSVCLCVCVLMYCVVVVPRGRPECPSVWPTVKVRSVCIFMCVFACF